MAEMVETTTVNISGNSNKSRAVLIVGGIALFVLGTSVGIYFLIKNKKGEIDNLDDDWTDNLENSLTNSNRPTVHKVDKSTSKNGFTCNSKTYPLQYGTCHSDVGILQQYLKRMYKADLGSSGANRDGVDKKFGAATQRAAIKYLKKSVFTPKDIIGIKAALKFTSK